MLLICYLARQFHTLDDQVLHSVAAVRPGELAATRFTLSPGMTALVIKGSKLRAEDRALPPSQPING